MTEPVDTVRIDTPKDRIALTNSLACQLHELRKQRRDITDQERDVERQLADIMDSDQINLGDKITLERRRGTKRTRWDSDGILNRLSTVARFSTHTGEEVDDATRYEQLLEALRECLPLTGSLSWRANALREWGFQPDEWATAEPGRVSVKVEIAT